MNIQQKLPDLDISIFTKMSALSNQYNAINLGQGFPDFPVNQLLIDAVSRAMNEGYNQYAPMQGLPALRQKVVEIIKNKYNRNTDIAQITITSGATQAIFNTISGFVVPKDEVIILDPAYDCYAPAVKLMGAKAVHIQMNALANEIPFDEIETKISSKTKMIIWNNPHNPTGNVYDKSIMKKWVNVLKDYPNIIFLSDEVYEHIDFTESFYSAHQVEELYNQSIVISSFGKTFHATGWKVGYAVASKNIIQEFNKVHQYNVFAVNHAVQKGLADYITNDNYKISSMYNDKRDLLLSYLKKSNFKVVGGGGTYFQLLDYSAISHESDIDFTISLVKEYGITTIPISVFNKDKLDQKLIRICFAKQDETLQKAGELLCKI